MKPKSLSTLASDRYKESGLTVSDAKVLGLQPITAKQTKALCSKFKALVAIKIPYMDPFCPGKALKPWPKWPDFYRLRYLEEPDGFDEQTEKKALRYVQPPESGVCAYFPTNQKDWAKILKDSSVPLVITEGEFKAAKSCKEGYPTIGLGGVYSFRSSKLGLMFLKELEEIDWVKRCVYIVYDSDFRTNKNICGALNALGKELMARGAQPHIVSLPDVNPDGKTGLDDFLIARGAGNLLTLLQDQAQPITLSEKLWALNDSVLYVHDPGIVINLKTDQKYSPSAFKEHAYSTVDYAEQTVKPDGNVSYKPVSAATAWLKWPLRGEVGYMTYAPGQEKLVDNAYNIWPGWGIEPKKGKIDPFLKLLDHLFTGAEKGVLEWFIRWCAYPIQFPLTNLYTASVLYGTMHGTGKSLVGYTMGRIYGKNFTEIAQADLHGSFNEWAEGKQFIMGDDVTGSDKRQDADMLKKLITQLELRVNAKYVPSYTVPDCVNYFFTSNHPDAFFLEDDDRRYFIHEVQVGPLGEQFYIDYMKWLNDKGAAAIFDYLLKLKLGDFNPAAPALKTAARGKMIADVKSDLGSWVARLKLEPDRVLMCGEIAMKSDLYSPRQLLELYDPTGQTKTKPNGLGRELRRSGVPQICNGAPIHTSFGQERLYIIRNKEKWIKAGRADVLSHISKLDKIKEKKF